MSTDRQVPEPDFPCMLTAFGEPAEWERNSRVVVLPGLLSRTIADPFVAMVASFLADLRPDRIVTTYDHRTDTALRMGLTASAAEVIAALLGSYEGDLLVQSVAIDGLSNVSKEVIEYASVPRLSIVTGSHPIMPGWLSVCASEPIETKYPGRRAINLARSQHKSTICIGTRESGIIRETVRHSGVRSVVWGVDVGLRVPTVVVIDSPRGKIVPTVIELKRDGLIYEGIAYKPQR